MVASNLYLKSFRVNRHLYSLQLSKEKLFFSFYLMIYFYCWFLCKCCWWIYRENAKKKILCIKALEEINIIEVLLETLRTFLRKPLDSCWRHSIFVGDPIFSLDTPRFSLDTPHSFIEDKIFSLETTIFLLETTRF